MEENIFSLFYIYASIYKSDIRVHNQISSPVRRSLCILYSFSLSQLNFIPTMSSRDIGVRLQIERVNHISFSGFLFYCDKGPLLRLRALL